jgi:hypothetical protein
MLVGLWILALAAPASQEEDLGTFENPILCSKVDGERWYLSRLRTPEGKPLDWSRRGSFGSNGKDQHILDGYRIDDTDRTLFLDMYHPGHVEIRAPKGFRLLSEWSARLEYVDRRLHAFGEAKPFTGDFSDERGEGEEKRVVRIRLRDGWVQEHVAWHYPDGKLMKKMDYGKANRPHGVESWFRPDGAPWAVFRYEEGLLHGPWEIRGPDGTVESSGTYEKGQAKEEK